MKNNKTFFLEYYTGCAGHCFNCFLSNDERENKNINDSMSILKKELNELENNYEEIIFFIGRGNILSVKQEEFLEDLQNLFNIINESQLITKCNIISFEVTTSLIGNIENQIDTAKNILSVYQKQNFRQTDKFCFALVLNTELTSPNYWKNINYFTDELFKFRGSKDGDSDLIFLNLKLSTLPDIDFLKEKLKDNHCPIYLLWNPLPEAKNNLLGSIDRNEFDNWIINLFDWFAKEEKDNNVINNIKSTLQNEDNDIYNLEKNQNNFVYFDKQGIKHYGLFTLWSELVPIHFVEEKKEDETLYIHTNIEKEITNVLKNKKCQRCEVLQECLNLGGYKIANATNLLKTKHCPSFLDTMIKEVKYHPDKFKKFNY